MPLNEARSIKMQFLCRQRKTRCWCLQVTPTTRFCSQDVDRCQVASRGDILCDFGDRPDAYTEAEVHGLCQEGQKEATHRRARNTRAPTARPIVQPVSSIGEGIVLVMGDRLIGTCWLSAEANWHLDLDHGHAHDRIIKREHPGFEFQRATHIRKNKVPSRCDVPLERIKFFRLKHPVAKKTRKGIFLFSRE